MHCHGLGNDFAPSPNFTPYHPTSAPTLSHVHFHAPTLWRVCDPTKTDNTKKEGGTASHTTRTGRIPGRT